jgi:hypothetical protein
MQSVQSRSVIKVVAAAQNTQRLTSNPALQYKVSKSHKPRFWFSGSKDLRLKHPLGLFAFRLSSRLSAPLKEFEQTLVVIQNTIAHAIEGNQTIPSSAKERHIGDTKFSRGGSLPERQFAINYLSRFALVCSGDHSNTPSQDKKCQPLSVEGTSYQELSFAVRNDYKI